MIITVKQSKVTGKEQKTVLTEKVFYSFQGIPYAKPPVGELRFQAPQPLEIWPENLNATKEENMCLQRDFIFTRQIIGSEDCLYLNVYIPELPQKSKLRKAVMVFIHGGGFEVGSGSESFYSPDYLISHDIVVVTINYRLHILGFLSLDLPECPGNVGLKDMVLALQWVKENIISFGGDSENITIFGESAGSAAVHALIISPMTQGKGYFQKAILQSGSMFNPWAFTDNPLESAFLLGNFLGYNGTDKEELLELLKKTSTTELMEALKKVKNEIKKKTPARYGIYPFVPTVEGISEGAFFPEHPQKLNRKADSVTVIVGVTNQEGLGVYREEKIKIHINMFNSYPDKFVFSNLPVRQDDIPAISKELKEFYFKKETVTSDDLEQITAIYSDFIIVKDLYDTVGFIIENKAHPVYEYLFSYDGKRNIYKKILGGNVDIKGACHADELGYLFLGKLFPQTEYNEDDVNMINTITTLWTNFAKNGNPNGAAVNVTWPATSNTDPVYLEINKSLEVKKGKIFEDRIAFWKNLANKYFTY